MPQPAALAAQALGWTDPASGAVVPGIEPATTLLGGHRRPAPSSRAPASDPHSCDS
jgi:hypothetical protein